MVIATDKSARTAVKRPTTVTSDFIRRVGLSDIYMLTPGGTITVSVEKRGLYSGAVVYTSDILPTKHSSWTAATGDDTVDVTDVVIPIGSTGVAFVCSAVTETALPRVGAKFAVKDANAATNLTAHNRVRTYSGDIVQPTLNYLPPSQGLVNWMDFTDVTQLFTDTAGTIPVTADGQAIGNIADKGSRLDAADDVLNVGFGPIYRTNVLGSGHSAGELTNQAVGTYLRSVDANADWTTKRGVFAVFSRKVMTMTSQFPFRAPGDLQFCRPFHVTPNQLQWKGPQGKAEQIAFYEPGEIIAGWVLIDNADSGATSCSLNVVAGESSASYTTFAISNTRFDIGGASTVSNTFDGFLFELGFFDGDTPPSADIEAYVTNKYGLVWA